MRLYRAGPYCRIFIFVGDKPTLAQATVFEIKLEPPFAVQKFINILTINRARQAATDCVYGSETAA